MTNWKGRWIYGRDDAPFLMGMALRGFQTRAAQGRAPGGGEPGVGRLLCRRPVADQARPAARRRGPVAGGGVLPTVAGVILLAAYTRYLREIDELQRAIQLRALALGFGGGFLGICGYVTFQPLGAPQVDPVSLLVVMPVLYAIGILVGSGRYR